MASRKSLLEKYEIPINHLEFEYIRNCTDGREMEKIVTILRSGEEGYFPHLTVCAENKLRELKPNSRLFRYEEDLRTQMLAENELYPVMQWTESMRDQDNRLTSMCRQAAEMMRNYGYQEIRRAGRIIQREEAHQRFIADPPNSSRTPRHHRPVASTDYKRWDKYDPDEDLLRMELDEERIKEEVERKNRVNSLKSQPTPLISELAKQPVANVKSDADKQLSDVETENLCLEYRIRGNEFYRAKEYENAIAEYNKALEHFVDPQTGAYAYCNRAVALMKLKKYEEALSDCERCLELQPDNLKALLRLAEIKIQLNQKSDAFHTYARVLEFHPQNRIAAKGMQDILEEFNCHIPPMNATRMQIAEDQPTTSKAAGRKHRHNDMRSNQNENVSQTVDYDSLDYSQLIRPATTDMRNRYYVARATNDLRMAKQEQARAVNSASSSEGASSRSSKQQISKSEESELRLPVDRPKATAGNVLIEELKKN